MVKQFRGKKGDFIGFEQDSYNTRKIGINIFILLFSKLVIAAPYFSYCQAAYGDEATLTFEPIEANSIGVTDFGFSTKKVQAVKQKDAPEPTAFMCQINLKKYAKQKCPKGMHLNTKRENSPICLTKKIALKELCPKEIAETWPEIKEKICNTPDSR